MNLESSEVLNVYQDYIVITALRILVSVFFLFGFVVHIVIETRYVMDVFSPAILNLVGEITQIL